MNIKSYNKMNKRLILILIKSLLLLNMVLGQAPYVFDKIDTSYSTSNIEMNHVFVNYNEKSDGSEKYIANGAFYLKNTVAANDAVIDVKRSSLGYVSLAPTVS